MTECGRTMVIIFPIIKEARPSIFFDHSVCSSCSKLAGNEAECEKESQVWHGGQVKRVWE